MFKQKHPFSLLEFMRLLLLSSTLLDNLLHLIISTNVCIEVPKVDCQELNRQSCQEVPVRDCQQKSRRVCSLVPRIQTKEVSERKCSTVTSRQCNQVPKQVILALVQPLAISCFFFIHLN